MLDIVLLCTDHGKTNEQLERLLATSCYKDGGIGVTIADFTGEFENAQKGVQIFDASAMTLGRGLNAALDKTSGELIMFAATDGVYTDKGLKRIISLTGRTGISSLHPWYTNSNGEVVSVTSFKVNTDKKGAMPVDMAVSPEKFHLCFAAFAFEKKLFAGRRFDEELQLECEHKMLLELLDSNGRYTFIDEQFLMTDPPEMDFFNYSPQFDRSWYEDCMDDFLIGAVKENSSEFVQRFVLYLIVCRYACNMNERDKGLLNPEEAQAFFERTGRALKNIDDVVIASCHMLNGSGIVPKFLSLNLLRMKYGDEHLMPTISATAGEISAHIGGAQIWKLDGTKIEFKSVYSDDEKLVMDGFFPGVYAFPEGGMKIIALLNQSIPVPVRENHIYALNKFFNISAKGNYTFCFTLPLKDLEKVTSISFWLVYNGRKYPLDVTFIRAMSKFSNIKTSYWVCDKSIISYHSNTRSFDVEPLTKKAHRAHEMAFLRSVWRGTKGTWRLKMFGNRVLYWVTKPFYKNKKIWLTQDKLFKAGDNGEYFYRYVKAHQPEGIKIYYVVDKKSPDYPRLKKEFDTVLVFSSLKHRIIALHTDLMLATHVDTLTCNGYYGAIQKYFKDLYNARVVCLAHGLTIQRIAQYQNRVFDNTQLYFFASKYEVKNVSHEVYDYFDERALCLTGHARYDGLKSNDRKIILITPTWRRSVTTGKAAKGQVYGHSSNFVHSDYYKIYNGLINDERLIKTAKEHGYRIVYLLHPAMSSQLEDFEKSEGVDIVAAASDISYEKILTESSLMVTDYSGVQFDFAYMKKPLVYYHPDILPPQYEAGGLEYETMGFGPICRDHEQIVDTLCGYIERSCVMEDMYKERVDDFFRYSDHNNCERIFKEVMAFQNRFGKVNEYKHITGGQE
ncbi:CDP-glycerol glycerophosphotransferase family protein [Ruminococcus sp.]|uniref:CDP-glycerol glycerophosphotransferase family protein n=1 Tax=Ruminococcus sp. TaxID=41978 RepID=UPI0025E7D852|nr:CDP-glycerol glycerophosphotransferase family protein [Ruminococcus sp.]MBQ8964947.1 CDP-glycerol glycerophosphotransferase family protein [Ruminococcus sp.]